MLSIAPSAGRFDTPRAGGRRLVDHDVDVAARLLDQRAEPPVHRVPVVPLVPDQSERVRRATERRLHHAVVSDETPGSPEPARVAGPITGASAPWGAPDIDLDAHGYLLEEFALEGTARAFHLLTDPTPDGRWAVAEFRNIGCQPS